MKKQVKKFMSALLACVMVAVSVIVFDMNPVHAASGAITEASGWLETAYVKWDTCNRSYRLQCIC